MDATNQLEQSHLMVIQVIDDLPEQLWDTPGVCGTWSVKDTLAHLTFYEHLLVDAFNAFQGAETTPALLKLGDPVFNKDAVEARQYHTAQQVVDEFNEIQLQSSDLLARIPAEKIIQAGTIPWYQKDSNLADLIKSFYIHAQEHCAQIKAFRESEPGA